VPLVTQMAREKDVSAYIGDGANRWAAAPLHDVAHLYRLVVEKTGEGCRTSFDDRHGSKSGLSDSPGHAFSVSSILLRCSPDGVELCDDLGFKLKPGYAEVLAQMFDRRCARDQQDVGRPVEQPCQRHLHRSGIERRSHVIELR
jgi:hypothetical protein